MTVPVSFNGQGEVDKKIRYVIGPTPKDCPLIVVTDPAALKVIIDEFVREVKPGAKLSIEARLMTDEEVSSITSVI